MAGPAEAKLHWSGLLVLVAECMRTLACAQKLGGVGACSPGIFFEFNAVRWLLRLFWGPKRHYYSLL